MAKEIFIPNWYIDKRSQVKSKKMKIIMAIFILLNILIGMYILNISTKIRNIRKEISLKKSNAEKTANNNEVVKKDNVITEKYKEIADYFQINSLNYSNLFMSRDNFEIDMQVRDYEEYISVIKCIEKKYSIKNLTTLSENEKEYRFKVIF